MARPQSTPARKRARRLDGSMRIAIHHTTLRPWIEGRPSLGLWMASSPSGALVSHHEILLQLPRSGVHRECNWLR